MTYLLLTLLAGVFLYLYLMRRRARLKSQR